MDALEASGALIAPKALALTLFVRLFCCDLFIHGVGGGRYDQVTDGVIRHYFGVEPPAFVVASMTMYLPLGAHVVSDEEVGAARERLNRLEHNPDALLGEVEFDSDAERDRATDLAAEKTRLVEQIAKPDADKKALGIRIREVNAEFGRRPRATQVRVRGRARCSRSGEGRIGDTHRPHVSVLLLGPFRDRRQGLVERIAARTGS